MRRIVHLLPGKANPDRMNGVNKVVDRLATLMQEKSVDVTVIGITADPDATTIARPYPLRLFRGRARSFYVCPALRDFIRDLPDDSIVHFHGVMLPVFFTIAAILRRRGIGYVVTPHGALLPRSMRKHAGFKKIYLALFERRFLKHARALQAITAMERDTLLAYNAAVSLIPNGYIGPYRAQDPQNPAIVFGYIGRLSAAHKGLDALIDGFALYRRQHQTGSLWLVGDGEDRAALVAQVARHHIQDHVIFHGERHGPEKAALLDKMDVFVHPSRWDVLPTAILEAAAHGKPLIVTKATGFAQAIEQYHAGFVLPDSDPQAIAQAMEKALAMHGDLPAMGERAGQMIKQDYDAAQIADKVLVDLYGIAA